MKNKLMLLAVVLVATGCAVQAEPDRFDVLSHRDPVDPEKESSGVHYHGVVAGYHSRTVVEPKPWTDTAVDAEKPEGNSQ